MCSKVRHQKWSCPRAKNVDHIEITTRKNARSGKFPDDIDKREKKSTTYVVDKEMEAFVASHTDAYARYRLCENP